MARSIGQAVLCFFLVCTCATPAAAAQGEVDLGIGSLCLAISGSHLVFRVGDLCVVSDEKGEAVLRISSIKAKGKSKAGACLAGILRADYPHLLAVSEQKVSLAGMEGIEYALQSAAYEYDGVRAFGGEGEDGKHILVIGKWSSEKSRKRVGDLFRKLKYKSDKKKYEKLSKALAGANNCAKLLKRAKKSRSRQVKVWARYTDCAKCKGKGYAKKKSGLRWMCEECDGRGDIPVKEKTIKCPKCFGTGKVLGNECDKCADTPDKVECHKCHGDGVYRGRRCKECNGKGMVSGTGMLVVPVKRKKGPSSCRKISFSSDS